MKLKDRFSKAIMRNEIEETLEQCTKVAEKFAIEFGEWIQFHSELWMKYNRKQLLEIFKKEKGL